MSSAIAELFGAMAGIVLVAAVFAWLAFLPALGLLWILGWLS